MHAQASSPSGSIARAVEAANADGSYDSPFKRRRRSGPRQVRTRAWTTRNRPSVISPSIELCRSRAVHQKLKTAAIPYSKPTERTYSFSGNAGSSIKCGI